MKVGRIPEKMTAYLRPEHEGVGDGTPRNWWSFPPDKRETAGFSKYRASPAFVVPSDSEAFNKSGLDWACGGRHCVQIQKPEDVQKVTFDNEPFTDLRWVGIDSRSEGGMAYKVVTPEGWLVDLREDVVTECLFEGAIQSKSGPQGNGTYFTAEFVWVVMGSQSRIVRVGSKTYEEIAALDAMRNMGPIPEKDLEIGGVYRQSNGKEVILVGKGKEKGKKYYTMSADTYRWVGPLPQKIPPQEVVDGIMDILEKPNCLPAIHASGSLKVVEQTGQVEMPDGAFEAYLEKLKAWTQVDT